MIFFSEVSQASQKQDITPLLRAMEMRPQVNSSVTRRLWSALRITFFLIRKGFVSKRKLIRDLNLMIKRGKLLRRSFRNILSHHHHPLYATKRGSFGLQEHEFSCSNSPSPAFFHAHKLKLPYHYFPCINAPQVTEDDDEYNDCDPPAHRDPDALALVPRTPDYTFSLRLDASDFASGEEHSPLLSPFSVRVANYSSEDEGADGENKHVDTRAEEFIRRFYQQLRAQQSRIQLLQYQEQQYPQNAS